MSNKILKLDKIYLERAKQFTLKSPENYALFVTSLDLDIIHAEGPALRILGINSEKDLAQLLYPPDLSEIQTAVSQISKNFPRDIGFYDGIGMLIKTERSDERDCFRHYRLSCRAPGFEENKRTGNLVLAIREEECDYNPQPNGKRIDIRTNSDKYSIIHEIEKAKKDLSNKFTIFIERGCKLGDEIIHAIGSTFSKGQLNVVGTKNLPPFDYTALRELCQLVPGKTKKHLGLQELSMTHYIDNKTTY